MWNIVRGKRFAKDLWSRTQRVGSTDAAVAGALLAQLTKGEARRLLADCVAKEKPTHARGTAARPDALEDDAAEISANKAVASRERALPRVNAKQGAVRLVTLIESRARARGLVVDRSPVQADHAISISVRGAIACTVSALDGDVYVDPIGPAPAQKTALAWDAAAEVFLPTDAAAWPDPVALVENEVAMLVRQARKRRDRVAA